MKHISALSWFRFESADLGFGEWVALRLHVMRCASCRAQLDRRRALGVESRSYRPQWALVAAALMVGVIGSVAWLGRDDANHGDLVMKGDSRFNIVQVKSTPAAAPFAELCSPGDVLQAEVWSSKPYVVVVSFSGGQTQVLYPRDSGRSGPVVNGHVRMPESWVLDGAPGLEQFSAVFSDVPLPVDDIKRAISTGQPIANAEVVSRRCHKRDAGS